MFFGNSRVTIQKIENCDSYALTDKTFALSIATGLEKDNIFLAYAKNCLGFDGWDDLVKLQYACFEQPFCSDFIPDPDDVGQGTPCDTFAENLTGNDVYILENSFSNIDTTINNPFCTFDYSEQQCNCPPGFVDEGNSCFKLFPIESIGLNFTDEIEPCKFLFLAQQVDGGFQNIETINPSVTIYYKSYEKGTQVCKVATFEYPSNPCLDLGYACWPAGVPSYISFPDPETGEPIEPCEYCRRNNIAGDICYFEGLEIASNTCKCPYTAICYDQNYDFENPGPSGNCFFSPGITTTEPCVNGSWNGASCADGYNDVCASTDCIDKICKELDWFIENYAGFENSSWLGYSSLANPLDVDYFISGTTAEFWVSCGPTGVTARDVTTPITVTFGENSSLRQWGRIVGFLNYWTKDDPSYLGQVFDTTSTNLRTLPLSESLGVTSCGWFYPTNLCCPSIVRGSFDYDCPICGPSGFTDHSSSETSCCCGQNIIPIVYGLNDEPGFAEAATGVSSIGIQPNTSLKG